MSRRLPHEFELAAGTIIWGLMAVAFSTATILSSIEVKPILFDMAAISIVAFFLFLSAFLQQGLDED